MSSYFFFDRRASERFAELLEDADRLRSHRRPSQADAEMERGVRMLWRLRRFPDHTFASRDFREGLRAMLMAAAHRQSQGLAGAEAEPTVPLGALADQPVRARARSHRGQSVLRSPGPGTARTRAAVLVGVTAGALALSGVSAASTDSLPGDPLYQVKRSSERAQLALAASDQTRGQLYLEFAHSRLLEAHRIGDGLVADVLSDMDGETVAGVSLLTTAAVQRHDASILTAITAFVSDQRGRLADLHKTLTETGAEPLRRSGVLLDSIEQRTRALAHALLEGCAIPTVDTLGPKPTVC